MKTIVFSLLTLWGFCARAQYNFSIENEEIEAHTVVLPYDDEGTAVVYDITFENIEGATSDDLMYAFQRWYQDFYNSNFDISYAEDGDGKYKMDFRYVFRFWNGASYKTVSTKTELRFYAQDGRARVVVTDICYKLYEGDILTPRIVKGIRNISRAVDAAESGDPNYPYTVETLDKEGTSGMKKKWLTSGDIVILKIIKSLEEALRDFEKEEEEDKW